MLDTPMQPSAWVQFDVVRDAQTAAQFSINACDHWFKAFRRLDELAGYSANWDNDGAIKPDVKILASAADLLDKLRASGWEAPVTMVLLPEGGLMIEWQAAGTVRTIEISKPCKGELLLTVDGTSLFDAFEWHSPRLDELLHRLPEAAFGFVERTYRNSPTRENRYRSRRSAMAMTTLEESL